MLSAIDKVAEDRQCQCTGTIPGRGQQARTGLQEQPAPSFAVGDRQSALTSIIRGVTWHHSGCIRHWGHKEQC